MSKLALRFDGIFRTELCDQVHVTSCSVSNYFRMYTHDGGTTNRSKSKLMATYIWM